MDCANVMQLDCAEFMTLDCAEFFSAIDLVTCPAEVRDGLLTGTAWAEATNGKTGETSCVLYSDFKHGLQVDGKLRHGAAKPDGNWRHGAARPV